jgi:hypothetical protein
MKDRPTQSRPRRPSIADSKALCVQSWDLSVHAPTRLSLLHASNDKSPGPEARPAEPRKRNTTIDP